MPGAGGMNAAPTGATTGAHRVHAAPPHIQALVPPRASPRAKGVEGAEPLVIQAKLESKEFPLPLGRGLGGGAPYLAARRFSTSFQLTTFHHAEMYSGRRFWYFR